MKFSGTLPETVYEKLDALALERGLKDVGELFAKNANALSKINHQKNQIVLESEHIDKISQAFGGKILKTADDVTKLFVDNFKISVDGTEVSLQPEDAQAFKDQFPGTGYKDYNTYVSDRIKEAVSMELWGSYRNVI